MDAEKRGYTNLRFPKSMVRTSAPLTGRDGGEYRLINGKLFPGTEIDGVDLGWYEVTSYLRDWQQAIIDDPAEKTVPIGVPAGKPVELRRFDTKTGQEQSFTAMPEQIAAAMRAQRSQRKGHSVELVEIEFPKSMVTLDPSVRDGSESRLITGILLPGTEIDGVDLSWYEVTGHLHDWQQAIIDDPAEKTVPIVVPAGKPVDLHFFDATIGSTGEERTFTAMPEQIAAAAAKRISVELVEIEFPKSAVTLSEPRVREDGSEYRFVNAKLFPGTEIDGVDLGWYRLSKIATPYVIGQIERPGLRVRIPVAADRLVKLDFWDKATGDSYVREVEPTALIDAIQKEKTRYINVKNAPRPASMTRGKVGTAALKEQAARGLENHAGVQGAPAPERGHGMGR